MDCRWLLLLPVPSAADVDRPHGSFGRYDRWCSADRTSTFDGARARSRLVRCYFARVSIASPLAKRRLTDADRRRTTMHTHFRNALAGLVAVLAIATVSASEAVIDRWAAAVGGRDALSKIQV